MSCINLNHPDFKKLQDKYNVSTSALEAFVNAFKASKNVEDCDFNDPELTNYLDKAFKVKSENFISDKETFDTLHNYWQNAINEEGIVIDINDDKINSLSQIFGSDNVIAYETKDGERVARIAEPILKMRSVNELLNQIAVEPEESKTKEEKEEEIEIDDSDKLTEEERQAAAIDELLPSKLEPEYHFSPEEINQKMEKVFSEHVLSEDERTFISTEIMKLMSTLIDELLVDPQTSTFYFKGLFYEYDFTKMTRAQVIDTIGIQNLLEYGVKKILNYVLSETDSLNTFKKIRYVLDNWIVFIELGNNALQTLEGYKITSQKVKNQETENLDYDLESSTEENDLEEQSKESWQESQVRVSPKTRLTQSIKRVMSTCEMKDADGNTIADEFGFGLPRYVDENRAFYSIQKWVRNDRTIDQMIETLKEKSQKHLWVTPLIEKLDKEPFRTEFFTGLRNEFNSFSTFHVFRNPSGEITKVIRVQENASKSASNAYNLIKKKFTDGKMRHIINPTGEYGAGRINKEFVESFDKKYRTAHQILNTAKRNARTVADYTNAINRVAGSFAELCGDLGYNVTKDEIFDILYIPSMKQLNSNTVNLSSGKFLAALGTVNDRFKKVLKKQQEDKISTYNPINEADSYKVTVELKSLAVIINEFAEDTTEQSAHIDGKDYYSYVMSSHLKKILSMLSMSNQGDFLNAIDKYYGIDRRFKDQDGNWNLYWLDKLRDPNNRRELEHTTLISADTIEYSEMSPLQLQMVMIDMFANANNKDYGWYAMPLYGDKKALDFIKFKKFSREKYINEAINALRGTFNFELVRMISVLQRAVNPDTEPIKNFDVDAKKLTKDFVNKLKNKRSITRQDLNNNIKVLKKSGASFRTLSFMNNILLEDNDLSTYIIAKINGQDIDENDFLKKLDSSLADYMQQYADEQIQSLKDKGLFEKEEINGQETYKYLSNIVSGYDAEIKDAGLEEELKYFFYNNKIAEINLIQLSSIDEAYYKNSIDLQKRFAEHHSMTRKPNITARDRNGQLYSKDGKMRTMYIQDEIVKSDAYSSIELIFDNKIENAKTDTEKKQWKELKEQFLSKFNEINVTDAQSYNSPTSYRKKMGMMGKWNDESEDAYQRIIKGDLNINDMNLLWQPTKQFTYSNIIKPGNSEIMNNMLVGVQHKNSEYMLFLADAITRSGKQTNRLTAIYDFMEESAYDNRQMRNGKPLQGKEGAYNGIGIDAIMFQSAVKKGEQGVINLNDAKSYDEIKAILERSAYMDEQRLNSDGDQRYNANYVHTIPFEDYGIQQETPKHFYDDEDSVHSQIRILNITDGNNDMTFEVYSGKDENGKDKVEQVSYNDLVKEYKNLVAENIDASWKALRDELALTKTRKEKDKKIQDFLRREALNSGRYDTDFLRMVTLDENGEFTIPLCDPINSRQLQNLILSIVKNRIQKQKMTGGSLIQATSYGVSDELNIRFKDKNGGLLMTLSEFASKEGKSKEEASDAYKSYLKENQASLSHYEAYIAIPNSQMDKVLREKDDDGTEHYMDVDKAIRKGIISKEQLKMISYRIPTEGKISMMPVVIKGFLPKVSGDVIMLPKEITMITGSDYDVDKMYVKMKSFSMKQRFNRKDFKNHLISQDMSREDRKLVTDRIDIFLDTMENGNEQYLANDEIDKLLLEYYNRWRHRFTNNIFEEIKNGRDGRNNRLFNIQYALLSSPNFDADMFCPSSFDKQKRVSRVIRILTNDSLKEKYSLNELMRKSIDKLDDILEDEDLERNMSDFSSFIYFFEQNMTAAKLIGAFANANTSHGFVQFQNVRLKDNVNLTFNGQNLSGMKLDPVYGFNGQLVTREIGTFLASAVDAVKDPVLNYMNINTTTVNVACLLLRLGFGTKDVALFLSQPAIRTLAANYQKNSVNGFTTIDLEIQNMLSDTENDLYTSYKATIGQTNFSERELIKNLNKNDNNFNIRTLLLFSELNKLATDLSKIVTATRFNSATQYAGPTIADTMILKDKVNSITSENFAFTKTPIEIINDDPILKAFYDATINGSKEIMSQWFPHYDDKVTSLINYVKQSTKTKLDEKTINMLISDFMFYSMTQSKNSDGAFDMSEEKRKDLVKRLPARLEKMKSKLPNNAIVSAMQIEEMKQGQPLDVLMLHTLGLTDEIKEQYSNAWSELFLSEDEEVKAFASDLFMYSVMRNGFIFSPKTFFKSANISVKKQVPKYVDNLKNIHDMLYNQDEINFVMQFVRNHPDSKLVRGIPNNIKPTVRGNTLIFALLKKNRSFFQINSFSYQEYIRYKGNLYVKTDRDNESIKYTKIDNLLGFRNNFIEYDSNTSAENMKKTITIPQRTIDGVTSKDSDVERDESDIPSKSDSEITPEELKDYINDDTEVFVTVLGYVSNAAEFWEEVKSESEEEIFKKVSEKLNEKLQDPSIGEQEKNIIKGFKKKMC